MTVNGYTSRNIPDPKIYEDMLERRMQAKKSGDKATANALKLIANTTYGATLNPFNDLYDPLMARSVCISGQLYLIELSNHLYQAVPDLRILQTNTDGIMVEFDDSHYSLVKEITDEWQRRTGFELEEDVISRIYQKDVNGYIEVAEDGTVKKKGGYLVRGIAQAGAFNVNNNATIVAKAITEFFVNGTPVEDTVNGCTDIFEFQIIAKAGVKYREAYHIVDGEKRPVQKVNRVYATTDPRYGRLYKVKADNGSEAKIDSLPEHCIIDNTAVADPDHTTVDKIDRQFYIDMARKRVNDFLGIEPEKPKKERNKKMPRTTAAPKEAPAEQAPMNVLQKLLKARAMFTAERVKKSGMNTDIEFMYFELKDIVPVATPIFEELGLLPVVYMDREMAYMDIIDTDNREDKITFTIPLATWQGNKAVNPIQVMGATITYYRRYFYQIALDIVERDEIDDKPQSFFAQAESAPAPKIPASAEERAEIRNELTDPEGMADELQLYQIKNSLRNLRDKVKNDARYHDPVEEWMANIAVQTAGFTEISKAACSKILTLVSGMLEDKWPDIIKPAEADHE